MVNSLLLTLRGLRSKTKRGFNNRFIEQRSPFIWPFLLTLPSLILTILLLIMPLLFALHSSLKFQTGFKQSEYEISLRNFTNIVNDGNFRLALENTLLLTFIGVPISITLALFISASIVKIANHIARGFWQTLFFLPYVTNAVAISLAFSYLFWPVGVINSFFGIKYDWLRSGLTASDQTPGTRWSVFFVMLVNSLWLNQAFAILILTTALLSVPNSLYRAGRVDGASPRRQFFSITLPSIEKQILFLVTFQLIHGLKAFPLGLFSNSEVRATTSKGLTLLILLSQYTRRGDFGYAGATTLIIFAISLTLTLLTRTLIRHLSLLSNKAKVRRRLNQVKSLTSIQQLAPGEPNPGSPKGSKRGASRGDRAALMGASLKQRRFRLILILTTATLILTSVLLATLLGGGGDA